MTKSGFQAAGTIAIGVAISLLAAAPGVSLGDYLAQHGFRGPMLDDYLLPMAGAIAQPRLARM